MVEIDFNFIKVFLCGKKNDSYYYQNEVKIQYSVKKLSVLILSLLFTAILGVLRSLNG